jgi:serine/threonine protein kinase
MHASLGEHDPHARATGCELARVRKGILAASKIGRYEILGELGRGGMAMVHRARDPLFDREVAVKVLPRELLHEPSFRSRFEREARVIAGLEHPAIVPVYDFGEENDQPYIVMRLMSGGSLGDRLHAGALPLQEAARILTALAPALDKAHSKGIVHRDLKPSNILFDEHDNPYLADFGIARLTEASTVMTATGLMGTPAYMSPEQGNGERDLDGRSDLYALGVIVFQMLTGQLPYDADNPFAMVAKHISAPIPRIRAVRPDLPVKADQLINKAMAKHRDARYQNAGSIAADLATLPGTARAQNPNKGPRFSRPVRAARSPVPATERVRPASDAQELAPDLIANAPHVAKPSQPERLAPELTVQRGVAASPILARWQTSMSGYAKRLLFGRNFRFWLALGLSVVGGMLGSVPYIPLREAGAPPWVADLLGGTVTGLAIGLALMIVSPLRWVDVLALTVVWAAAGAIGGNYIRSLYANLDVFTAWVYGLTAIGAVRGAAVAIVLVRRLGRSVLVAPSVIIMVGWILATVIPALVISRTTYWSSATNLSTIFWGALEAIVGSGVMLWPVKQARDSKGSFTNS